MSEPWSTWTPRALCLDIPDPDNVFFPGYGNGADRPAKQMCSRCPVQTACLNDALTREHGLPSWSRYGVVGGLNGAERARLDHQRFELSGRVR